jgi:hypothetical protein
MGREGVYAFCSARICHKRRNRKKFGPFGHKRSASFFVSMPLLAFVWLYLIGWLFDRWRRKRGPFPFSPVITVEKSITLTTPGRLPKILLTVLTSSARFLLRAIRHLKATDHGVDGTPIPHRCGCGDRTPHL